MSEWKYWLLDAAGRCMSAFDKHGSQSQEYAEACVRRDQIREAVLAELEPEQLSLEMAA